MGNGAELWTKPQRRVLAGLMAALLAVLCVRYARNTMHVDERGVAALDRSGELAGRIDPDTASADDLAALPVLGAKQAQAIVEYRKQAAPANGRRVFSAAEDLLKVKGIGVQTIEALRPYLLFEAPEEQPPDDQEPTTMSSGR